MMQNKFWNVPLSQHCAVWTRMHTSVQGPTPKKCFVFICVFFLLLCLSRYFPADRTENILEPSGNKNWFQEDGRTNFAKFQWVQILCGPFGNFLDVGPSRMLARDGFNFGDLAPIVCRFHWQNAFAPYMRQLHICGIMGCLGRGGVSRKWLNGGICTHLLL